MNVKDKQHISIKDIGVKMFHIFTSDNWWRVSGNWRMQNHKDIPVGVVSNEGTRIAMAH